MSLRALFQLENDGRPITSPDPKGPPKLINYIADRDAPDVAHIEQVLNKAKRRLPC